jgi:hypothetical protein
MHSHHPGTEEARSARSKKSSQIGPNQAIDQTKKSSQIRCQLHLPKCPLSLQVTRDSKLWPLQLQQNNILSPLQLQVIVNNACMAIVARVLSISTTGSTADVLRACHIIPAFAKGKHHVNGMGLLWCARDSSDWIEYYVNW